MLRREFLRWTGGACLAHSGIVEAQMQSQPEVGLDGLALRTGRRFGFAVQTSHYDNEPTRSLLQRHAGVITAELAMKWNIMSNL